MEGLDNRQHNVAKPKEPADPVWIPGHSSPEVPEFTPADSEELRFSLKELFIATTIAAAMLAAFRALGIIGAVFSFLTAAISTIYIIPHIIPKNIARQRLFFDFVWGMAMPVVCLVFDPLVFKQGDFRHDPLLWMNDLGAENLRISEHAYYAWPLLAGEIATLGAILVYGKKLRPIASVLAGGLFVGFVAALCLGVILSPLAAFATLLYGIGLLGFTPMFTCWAFFRRMRLMWFISKGEMPLERLYALAGFGILMCLVLAWIVGSLGLHLVPPKSLFSR
jgi:hypothetical protein